MRKWPRAVFAWASSRQRASWLGTIWQDLRYGTRSLWRDRAFTAAAIVTLTLGVGLVTVFFTIFNGILLRPWPLPDPDTLVTSRGISAAAYRHLRDRTRSIDLVAIAQACGSPIEDELRPSNVRCVSGNYFDVLRVPLALGRGFRPDEDVPESPVQVAVIGYRLWRDRFASSPEAIGQTIRVNGRPFQIVGVAAVGARDRPEPTLPQLWVPLAAYQLVMPDREFTRAFLFNPEYCCVTLAGRLRERGSHAAVSAELTASYRQFHRADGRALPIALTGTSEILRPWQDSGVAIVGLMLAAVTLVLLVAAANTGNLQLARGARRRGELFVRLSLGASRGRLVRQLLTEGMVLAGATAAVSLAFAATITRLLTRWLAAGGEAEFGVDLSPDWRVAFFAVLVAAAAVIGTGLGPALRGTRRLVLFSRPGAMPFRTRAWFLVVQVGLSAVLIVGSSLLGRALMRAASLDPGFDAGGVVRANVQVPPGAGEDARRAAAGDALRAALESPGPPLVADAGFDVHLSQVTVTQHDGQTTSIGPVRARSVSAEYLRLLDVPVRDGRLLREDDDPTDVVVNETFARRAWPDRSPLGSVFVVDSAGLRGTGGVGAVGSGGRRVVGVVGDIKPMQPNDPVQPTFFERGGGGTVYLRNETAVLDRARAAVRAVDSAAVLHVQPLSAQYAQGLEGIGIAVVFSWGLAFLALALAATGIFGVFALVAEERRLEVGIRVALGAGSRAIVGLMLRRAGRALGLGLLLGFAVALIAAPLLRSYLAGVGPYDPIAFAAAAILLAAAGAMATWIPIRRALRVDPASALRAE